MSNLQLLDSRLCSSSTPMTTLHTSASFVCSTIPPRPHFSQCHDVLVCASPAGGSSGRQPRQSAVRSWASSAPIGCKTLQVPSVVIFSSLCVRRGSTFIRIFCVIFFRLCFNTELRQHSHLIISPRKILVVPTEQNPFASVDVLCIQTKRCAFQDFPSFGAEGSGCQ